VIQIMIVHLVIYGVVMMTMIRINKDIKIPTKTIYEVVDGNIKNIKSSYIIYLGVFTTLLIFFYFYENNMVVFSSNIIFDYIINIVLFISCYLVVTTIFMYIYISYITKYIYNNLENLLTDVELDQLKDVKS